jgi:uncharacterized protein
VRMKRKVTIALITIVAVYLALCVAFYFLQEAMLFPGAYRGAAALDGVPDVEVSMLKTADGIEYRVAVATPKTRPRGVLLHFIGNGEDLRSGVHHAADYAAYGLRVIVTEYPGYGESGGKPSYTSIMAAAMATARVGKRLAAEAKVPLFLSGQSLGTFAAVHLAAQGIGDRMVLISPPTSIAAAGRHHYPVFPIGLLLRHPFDNLGNAAAVAIPTLVIHGDADRIVPFEMGKRVAAAIAGAKLHVVAGAGHNNLSVRRNGPLGSVIEAHLLPEK